MYGVWLSDSRSLRTKQEVALDEKPGNFFFLTNPLTPGPLLRGRGNPLIYTVILRSVRFRTRRDREALPSGRDLGLHTKYLTRLRFSSSRGEEVNICVHLSASVVYLKIWPRSFAPGGAQDDKRRVTCKASAVPLFLPLEGSRSIPSGKRLGEGENVVNKHPSPLALFTWREGVSICVHQP